MHFSFSFTSVMESRPQEIDVCVYFRFQLTPKLVVLVKTCCPNDKFTKNTLQIYLIYFSMASFNDINSIL